MRMDNRRFLLQAGDRIMKHWEVEHSGEHFRLQWNEAATFNLQAPIGGQWVDYHCFTCYGIDTEQEAFEHAMEVLEETEADVSS